MTAYADTADIKFVFQPRSKLFEAPKGIDDKGDIFGPVCPAARITDCVKHRAPEAVICNGIGMRWMDAYVTKACPVLT